MITSLVLTIIGQDRPGLVEVLSQTLVDHDANWLESRMASLAGEFAGIVHVDVPRAKSKQLIEALERLDTKGLRIVVEPSHPEIAPPGHRMLKLELLGQDRIGIVHDISQALADKQVSIEEFHTDTRSASWSGETLFEATAELYVPDHVSVGEVREALEVLADELMVEVTLKEHS